MAQSKLVAAGAAQADRLDALLEQRFSARPDASLARQLAEHDRQRAAAAPPQAPQNRLRFLGAIAEPVQRRLREWIPALLAYAGEQGLAMRSLVLQLEVYDPAAYQAQHGAIAGQMRLPASSYLFNPLYRAYTVRLVLPERLAALEDLLASLRALLTRLYGDIWLQEEVFSLEAYREDVAPAAAE
ncbi:MAG TPA: hypothetical protein VL359_20520, partial [bacterium]|nr:hypothetical protein [bacterium]